MCVAVSILLPTLPFDCSAVAGVLSHRFVGLRRFVHHLRRMLLLDSKAQRTAPTVRAHSHAHTSDHLKPQSREFAQTYAMVNHTMIYIINTGLLTR